MSLTKVSFSMISGAVANVLDFGAKGDGTTDDTSSIQAALTAANSVYFPSGTYLVSSLTLKSNNVLFGDGFSSTIKQSSTSVLLIALSASTSTYVENIKIDSLQLLGQVATLGFSEYVHLASFNGVRNCTISNSFITGFRGDGIYLGNGGSDRHNKNVSIVNTVIDGVNSDNRNGVSVIDCDALLISGNTFKNCTRSNMPGPIDIEPNFTTDIVKNVKIVSNNFSTTNAAEGSIVVALTPALATSPQNFVISNNTFDDITHYAINIYVANKYAIPQNFTIANNTAKCLNFIRAYPYLKGCAITGNTINFDSTFSILGFAAGDAMEDVVLSNNVFVGTSTARALSIRDGSGIALTNNVFDSCLDYGVLCGIAGGTLNTVSFTNNTFLNIGGAGYSVGATGVVNGSKSVYRNNTHVGTHTFPAWNTDTTGDVSNGTSATSFNSATLPDSFNLGEFVATINGDTGVPSTGGYQGTLKTSKPFTTRKYAYQTYYPANNSTDLGSFYLRKADTSTNAWTAWYKVTGV